MKEHFRDDERGRRAAFYFFPWHFDFLSRYKPLPEETWAEAAKETPLMQTRFDPLPPDALPLERLLAHSDVRAHGLLASALWEASSEADAQTSLAALAESAELDEINREGGAHMGIGEDAELANIPDSDKKSGSGASGKKGRKAREQKPKRTEAEIAQVRAERAAKRERLGTPAHVPNPNR